jgi:ATP-dependent Clp protease ATP-binding subunit ClpB
VDEITQIVDLLLADLNNRLTDRCITVAMDKKTKEWIGSRGYDPVFGARPLKRYLQREIETKLARALVAAEIPEGAAVKFSVKDDKLVMK